MDDQATDRDRCETLEPQRSAISTIADLMTLNGALLLLFAIPSGMCVGAEAFWGDWLWAAISFAVMTLTMAALGGGLLATGLRLSRRQLHGK